MSRPDCGFRRGGSTHIVDTLDGAACRFIWETNRAVRTRAVALGIPRASTKQANYNAHLGRHRDPQDTWAVISGWGDCDGGDLRVHNPEGPVDVRVLGFTTAITDVEEFATF